MWGSAGTPITDPNWANLPSKEKGELKAKWFADNWAKPLKMDNKTFIDEFRQFDAATRETDEKNVSRAIKRGYAGIEESAGGVVQNLGETLKEGTEGKSFGQRMDAWVEESKLKDPTSLYDWARATASWLSMATRILKEGLIRPIGDLMEDSTAEEVKEVGKGISLRGNEDREAAGEFTLPRTDDFWDAPGMNIKHHGAQAGESLIGDILPAMAMGYLARSGGVAGSTAASLTTMGVKVYGQEYDRALKENGGNHKAASEVAFVRSAAETIPEMVPFGIAFKALSKVGKRLGMAGAFGTLLTTSQAEGLSEGVTEIINMEYDESNLGEYISREDWFQRIKDAYIVGQIMGVGMGAPGAMVSGTPQGVLSEEQADTLLDQMGAAVIDLKTGREARQGQEPLELPPPDQFGGPSPNIGGVPIDPQREDTTPPGRVESQIRPEDLFNLINDAFGEDKGLMDGVEAIVAKLESGEFSEAQANDALFGVINIPIDARQQFAQETGLIQDPRMNEATFNQSPVDETGAPVEEAFQDGEFTANEYGQLPEDNSVNDYSQANIDDLIKTARQLGAPAAPLQAALAGFRKAGQDLNKAFVTVSKELEEAGVENVQEQAQQDPRVVAATENMDGALQQSRAKVIDMIEKAEKKNADLYQKALEKQALEEEQKAAEAQAEAEKEQAKVPEDYEPEKRENPAPDRVKEAREKEREDQLKKAREDKKRTDKLKQEKENVSRQKDSSEQQEAEVGQADTPDVPRQKDSDGQEGGGSGRSKPEQGQQPQGNDTQGNVDKSPPSAVDTSGPGALTKPPEAAPEPEPTEEEIHGQPEPPPEPLPTREDYEEGSPDKPDEPPASGGGVAVVPKPEIDKVKIGLLSDNVYADSLTDDGIAERIKTARATIQSIDKLGESFEGEAKQLVDDIDILQAEQAKRKAAGPAVDTGSGDTGGLVTPPKAETILSDGTDISGSTYDELAQIQTKYAVAYGKLEDRVEDGDETVSDAEFKNSWDDLQKIINQRAKIAPEETDPWAFDGSQESIDKLDSYLDYGVRGKENILGSLIASVDAAMKSGEYHKLPEDLRLIAGIIKEDQKFKQVQFEKLHGAGSHIAFVPHDKFLKSWADNIEDFYTLDGEAVDTGAGEQGQLPPPAAGKTEDSPEILEQRDRIKVAKAALKAAKEAMDAADEAWANDSSDENVKRMALAAVELAEAKAENFKQDYILGKMRGEFLNTETGDFEYSPKTLEEAEALYEEYQKQMEEQGAQSLAAAATKARKNYEAEYPEDKPDDPETGGAGEIKKPRKGGKLEDEGLVIRRWIDQAVKDKTPAEQILSNLTAKVAKGKVFKPKLHPNATGAVQDYINKITRNLVSLPQFWGHIYYDTAFENTIKGILLERMSLEESKDATIDQLKHASEKYAEFMRKLSSAFDGAENMKDVIDVWSSIGSLRQYDRFEADAPLNWGLTLDDNNSANGNTNYAYVWNDRFRIRFLPYLSVVKDYEDESKRPGSYIRHSQSGWHRRLIAISAPTYKKDDSTGEVYSNLDWFWASSLKDTKKSLGDDFNVKDDFVLWASEYLRRQLSGDENHPSKLDKSLDRPTYKEWIRDTEIQTYPDPEGAVPEGQEGPEPEPVPDYTVGLPVPMLEADVRETDITPAQFKKEFGFNAGKLLGGWVKAKEDQKLLNALWDSLSDLANRMALPRRAIGHFGKMYITIGVLGKGKASAAFFHNYNVPDKNQNATGNIIDVINMTKTKGDGSVAHEWLHSVDYMLLREHPRSNDIKAKFQWMFKTDWSRGLSSLSRSRKYFTDSVESYINDLNNDDSYPYLGRQPDAYREEIWEDFSKIVEGRGYSQSKFQRDGNDLDPNYYGTYTEMMARSFESFIYDSLGGLSPYLVNEYVHEGHVTPENGYPGTPYPTGWERQYFNEIWQAFTDALTSDGKSFELDVDAFINFQTSWEIEMKAQLEAEEKFIDLQRARIKEAKDAFDARAVVREANAEQAAKDKESKAKEDELTDWQKLIKENEAEGKAAQIEDDFEKPEDNPDQDDYEDWEDEYTDQDYQDDLAILEGRESGEENHHNEDEDLSGPDTLTPEPVPVETEGEAVEVEEKPKPLAVKNKETKDNMAAAIKEAAKSGVEGISDILAGLSKIADELAEREIKRNKENGTKSITLNSNPNPFSKNSRDRLKDLFDPEVYKRAKPEFHGAVEKFRKAGASYGDLIRTLQILMGDNKAAFLALWRQFVNETGLDKKTLAYRRPKNAEIEGVVRPKKRNGDGAGPESGAGSPVDGTDQGLPSGDGGNNPVSPEGDGGGADGTARGAGGTRTGGLPGQRGIAGGTGTGSGQRSGPNESGASGQDTDGGSGRGVGGRAGRSDGDGGRTTGADGRNDPVDTGSKFQTFYDGLSALQNPGILTTRYLKEPMKNALEIIKKQLPTNIDSWVMQKLAYGEDAIFKDAFFGLQVDTIAAAIHNIEKFRKGVIIADQTGVGKGRQAAALMIYALENGYTPVFVTAKSVLFTDMKRDLEGIHRFDDVKPFFINAGKGFAETTVNEDGEVFTEVKHKQKPAHTLAVLKNLGENGTLNPAYNTIFMTYSQIKGVSSTKYRTGKN